MAKAGRALLTLALAGLLLDGCQQHLSLGRRINRQDPQGRSTHYSIHLSRGTYLAVAVVIDRVERRIRFRDPRGRTRLDLDSFQKPGATERIEWLAEESGEYELEIAPPEYPGMAGGYSIGIEQLRPGQASDRQRVSAFRLVAQARGLLDADPQQALTELSQALPTWRKLGDRSEQAATLALAGLAFSRLSDTARWLAAMQQALSLAQSLPDRLLEANLHEWTADALKFLGRRDQALPEFYRAIGMYQSLRQPGREAACWGRVGHSHLLSRDLERAEEVYRYQNFLCRKSGDREGTVPSLRGLANTSLSLGRPEEALDRYAEAGRILDTLDPGTDRTNFFVGQADVYAWMGSWQKARLYLRAALLSARSRKDKISEAITLNRLGNLEFDLGNSAAAEALYQESYDLARAVDKKGDIAYALSNLGRCSLRRGSFAEAKERFETSRETYEDDKDRASQADQRIYLARAEIGLSRLDAASALLEEAGRILEETRRSNKEHGIRSAAFGAMQSLYRARVTLFMDLQKGNPVQHWAARAFEAAEESRARTLVDELAENSAGPGPEDLRNPSTVGEIQKALLAPDTALLAYRLDQGKSFVWLLTDRQILAFPLPSRKEIEAQVDAVLDGWTSGSPRSEKEEKKARENEERLSRTLLGPLAGLLGDKRLLIVSDGDLQKLPFAALLEPGTDEPLLDRHEIVHLPSATFAVELRHSLRDRPRPARTIAILAPGFGNASGSELPAAARSLWGPLRYSTTEARQIRDFYPDPQEALLALDAEANMSLALGGKLSSYRFLHFATHGFLDLNSADRSGLVLYDVDKSGKRVTSILDASQISRLRLPADLVVLSACKTGLGKSVEGEGTLGLPRAFFRAGAARVVMSLWDVNDKSTSDLMEFFYRGLAQGGLSPAAALRQAQLELRKKYRSPYHWAGFILQGEYAGLPAQQNGRGGVL